MVQPAAASPSGLLWQAFSVAAGIASVAWKGSLQKKPQVLRYAYLLDRDSHGDRSSHWLLVDPLVWHPDPFGSWEGFIPVPIIFQVGSLITLLSLIPWR